MPAQTPCVHCGTVGFVRREYIITAKASLVQHYCGHCNHSWVDPEKDERRTQLRAIDLAPTDQPDHSR
jgi:hypothetical protein